MAAASLVSIPLMIAMRVGRAHDHGIDLAGQGDVVGVMALALDQSRVFGPQHRLADAELGDRPVVVLFARIWSLFADVHAA